MHHGTHLPCTGLIPEFLTANPLSTRWDLYFGNSGRGLEQPSQVKTG